MIVLINGSFGVGKTTAGRLLRRRMPGSVLFNPEWTGSVLMRLPLPLDGSGTDDFQDIAVWRRSVIAGARLFRAVAETVIIPMTFARKDYFDEVVSGVGAVDKLRAFCLKADHGEIVSRLRLRGDGRNEWALRKAQICVEAHRSGGFGEPVDTAGKPAEAVAEEIYRRIADGAGDLKSV